MSFIREKKIYCGSKYLEVDIIPCHENIKHNHKRSKKIKESLLSQKNINDKNAKRKLTQLIEANFTKGDLHISLTYNDKHLPGTLEDAEREVTNYIRRIKRKREKENLPPLKYIIITSFTRENFREEGKEPVRPHHHIIMNGGLSRDDIEDLWSCKRGKNKGSIGYVNADRLTPDPNTGFTAISVYLVRQPSNKRRWTCSQNLTRPVSRTNDYKYSRRKIASLVGSNKDISYWEKQYPGYYITDKDSGYEEVFNELTGWSIYLKMRKKE